MFDMKYKTPERRCLIYGLKVLLKDARDSKEKRWPNGYNDNYWEISIKPRKENKELPLELHSKLVREQNTKKVNK